MSNEDLDNLIDAFLAGDLDDTGREELAARLDSDPAAMRAFDEALHMEALLHAVHAAPADAADERRATEKLTQHLKKLQPEKSVPNRQHVNPRLVNRPATQASPSTFRAWMALAATVAIMFGMAFYFIYGNNQNAVKPTASGEKSGAPKQVFSVASGHVWVDGRDVREVAENEWLNIPAESSATLTAKDGSTVTLEAGASALLRARGATLLSGAARFGVKPGTESFVLETPVGSVNSAAGEFDARLQPASAGGPKNRRMELALSVSVASGTAQVDFDGATTRLTAGDSREFSPFADAKEPNFIPQRRFGPNGEERPDPGRPPPPGPGLMGPPRELAIIDAIFRREKELGLTEAQKNTLRDSRARISEHLAALGRDPQLRNLAKQRDAHTPGDDLRNRQLHDRIRERTNELLNVGNLPGDPLDVLTPKQEQLMRDDLEMLRPPPPRRGPGRDPQGREPLDRDPRDQGPPGRDPRDREHEPPPPRRPLPPPPRGPGNPNNGGPGPRPDQ